MWPTLLAHNCVTLLLLFIWAIYANGPASRLKSVIYSLTQEPVRVWGLIAPYFQKGFPFESFLINRGVLWNSTLPLPWWLWCDLQDQRSVEKSHVLKWTLLSRRIKGVLLHSPVIKYDSCCGSLLVQSALRLGCPLLPIRVHTYTYRFTTSYIA